jgi:hypothetical protein
VSFFFQDVIGGLGSDEGFGIGVVADDLARTVAILNDRLEPLAAGDCR